MRAAAVEYGQAVSDVQGDCDGCGVPVGVNLLPHSSLMY
jgi:hypothetical protein